MSWLPCPGTWQRHTTGWARNCVLRSAHLFAMNSIAARSVRWKATSTQASLACGGPPAQTIGNAVCLAGVTGTALAMEPTVERRAFFVAAAEKYIQNFKKGFTADGYCSEGMGYWNYGFGNFVLLAETLIQATDGRLDLFTDPLIKEVALFGPRMEIVPGVYPSFADCSIGSEPGTSLMAFLSRRFSLGMSDVEAKGIGLVGGRSRYLFTFALYGFDNLGHGRAPSR